MGEREILKGEKLKIGKKRKRRAASIAA